MFVDYVENGRGFGEVGQVLAGCHFDPGLLRPYTDSQGRKCVTVNTGRLNPKTGKPELEKRLISEIMGQGFYHPVYNATSLRKEDWIKVDETVIKTARSRLRAWSDLAAASTYRVNGMGTTILEHETMSDPGEALVDMDALSEGRADSPKFQLEGIPLPITHSNFHYSARQIAVSRNSGNGLDTISAEAAARRVAESVEKTLIGTLTGITYGGTNSLSYGRNSTVYGYTNFTPRLTKTNFTAPTGSNPEVTVGEILTARDQLYNNNFFGDFMIYHSTDWDKYLDNDYARLGGNNASMTLRERIEKIEGIKGCKRLDYLTSSTNPFTLIFVQMTGEVAQAVIGMDITTVQWESKGGMQLNFKVMCIMVPRLRADFSGQVGILHGTTS